MSAAEPAPAPPAAEVPAPAQEAANPETEVKPVAPAPVTEPAKTADAAPGT